MDFLDFAFLCATLKVDSARCTCRMDMIDSAFERLWSNLYDQVVGAAGIFSANRNFYGLDEKVEKSIFLDFVILLP